MIHYLKSCAQLSVVPRRRVAAIVAGASLIAGSAAAQRPATSAEPIVINAVVANMDEANNTADFTTISITQGNSKTHGRSGQCHGRGFPEQQVDCAGRVTIISETRGSLWQIEPFLEYRDGELCPR